MTEMAGFYYPRTATGQSSLLPSPPWYYSGDLLTIEYRTDPANVARLLPPRTTPPVGSVHPVGEKPKPLRSSGVNHLGLSVSDLDRSVTRFRRRAGGDVRANIWDLGIHPPHQSGKG